MRLRGGFSALALLIVLCSLSPGRVGAQSTASPEALRAAEELFAITSKDMMGQLASQMTAQAWSPLEARLRASAKLDDATLSELRGEFERIQRANVTELMKDAPAIYARHFSAQELRNLIAFYNSPTGQKALHTMPQITAELLEGMKPRLAAVQRDTIDAFDRILRQRGYIK